MDAIVRSANFNAVIGTSEADVADRVARVRARQVAKADESAVDAMLSNHYCTRISKRHNGTGRREAQAHARIGCEYAILNFPEAAYDRTGIELFEREVIPALA